jgi:protein SCO1
MEETMDLQALKHVQLSGPAIASGFIKVIVIMTFMISCQKQQTLPYYDNATLTPIWKEEQPVNIDTLHTIGDFNFINQDGNEVTNETFRNKVYVASFFFTICPNICPRLTTNMKMVADEFAGNDQVRFISHSVTPGIDSVARLKKYSDKYEIDSRQWHLVTGDRTEIYSLARQSYFAESEQGAQEGSSDFLHTEHFMLVDADGHVRGVYKGTLVPEVDRLKMDIRSLLAQN